MSSPRSPPWPPLLYCGSFPREIVNSDNRSIAAEGCCRYHDSLFMWTSSFSDMWQCSPITGAPVRDESPASWILKAFYPSGDRPYPIYRESGAGPDISPWPNSFQRRLLFILSSSEIHLHVTCLAPARAPPVVSPGHRCACPVPTSGDCPGVLYPQVVGASPRSAARHLLGRGPCG